MPYSDEHKRETQRKILRSAARLFNRKGFAGVTIGEIMKGAGLTHGGFYRHFRSKAELYAEAIRYFLYKEAPEPWQRPPAASCDPNQPFARYVLDAYLSTDHLKDVGGSCPLIGLPGDAARSSRAVRAAYREVAEQMVRLFNANLDGPNGRDLALVLVVLSVGGMVLARAIDDEALAGEFRKAARGHALTATGWEDRPAS
jgi:TetR/AcrR family transcriptional repressor of nem operon